MNTRCKKCGNVLASSSDNVEEGICVRCLDKKQCIKCGKHIGNSSNDDMRRSLCQGCLLKTR